MTDGCSWAERIVRSAPREPNGRARRTAGRSYQGLPLFQPAPAAMMRAASDPSEINSRRNLLKIASFGTVPPRYRPLAVGP